MLDPANGSVDVHSTDLRSAVVLHVMVCQHLPVGCMLNLGSRFLQKVLLDAT